MLIWKRHSDKKYKAIPYDSSCPPIVDKETERDQSDERDPGVDQAALILYDQYMISQ